MLLWRESSPSASPSLLSWGCDGCSRRPCSTGTAGKGVRLCVCVCVFMDRYASVVGGGGGWCLWRGNVGAEMAEFLGIC